MNLKELNPEQIEKEVFALVEDRLGVRRNEISPEKDLVNDLGADSLDSVELIMAIEQQFDITIPDSDTENIKTIGDILKYLNNYEVIG
ncbi:MAG: acyl carrier protein [Bacteroidales bacterium]|nr:acyl carrier protein [Bacteroidales bacterium]